jgi:hypothetical protein
MRPNTKCAALDFKGALLRDSARRSKETSMSKTSCVQRLDLARTRLRQWWAQWLDTRSELAELDACGDLERLAKDIGTSGSDLRMLVTKGSHVSKLLPARMERLRLDPARLTTEQVAILRDIQRVCAMCPSVGECAVGLREPYTDQCLEDWDEYCPNAERLRVLAALTMFDGRLA